MVTDKKALSAAKVLLEYYEQWSKRIVLDPFVDGMVVRLTKEVDRLTAATSRKPR